MLTHEVVSYQLLSFAHVRILDPNLFELFHHHSLSFGSCAEPDIIGPCAFQVQVLFTISFIDNENSVGCFPFLLPDVVVCHVSQSECL